MTSSCGVSCSSPDQESDERKCNYERYRGLVQNDFANSEYGCLPPPISVSNTLKGRRGAEFSGLQLAPVSLENIINPQPFLLSLRAHFQRLTFLKRRYIFT